MKVPNVILEWEPDVTTDPRSIALDEDVFDLFFPNEF
jgi:hypothetical protein